MADYIIQHGDSLWKIAKKFNTTVEALMHLNHISASKVHNLSVGATLHLPSHEGTPDSLLTLFFRGLDFKEFTPKKVKVEHDNKTTIHDTSELSAIPLMIYDHAKGLKVWITDLENKFIKVMDHEILPIGTWAVPISSSQIAFKGNLLAEKGKTETTATQTKKDVTEQAKKNNGQTQQQQTRVETGTPTHAIGTVFTSENLLLHPLNEKYRADIIAAAKAHKSTPQAIAAMLNAEAAKVRVKEKVKKKVKHKDSKGKVTITEEEKIVVKSTDGWDEESNKNNPALAQGLMQFFTAGWEEISKLSGTLLHQDCSTLKGEALYEKRWVAKYAIDAGAAYAERNLKRCADETGWAVDSLSPEEQAKLGYLFHHEGFGGGMRIMGHLIAGVSELTDKEAKKKLMGQLGGDENKANQIIEQYRGNPLDAYKGWFYTLVDAKINTKLFCVDKSKATDPRSMADIIAALTNTAASPKPKPKPKAALTPTKTTPITTPNKSATPLLTTSVPTTPPYKQQKDWFTSFIDFLHATSHLPDTTGGWINPLTICTLRTAKLSSKKSATFGMTRVDKHGHPRAHQGIDLAATPGTSIYAVADGQIVLPPNQTGDYGRNIMLRVGINDLPPAQAAAARHVFGEKIIAVNFFYAHLSEIELGNKEIIKIVKRGDILGKTGCTGNAKGMNTIELGAHLHFEVRNGTKNTTYPANLTNRTDPMFYIKNCTNR